jgi:hypothetical protein
MGYESLRDSKVFRIIYININEVFTNVGMIKTTTTMDLEFISFVILFLLFLIFVIYVIIYYFITFSIDFEDDDGKLQRYELRLGERLHFDFKEKKFSKVVA